MPFYNSKCCLKFNVPMSIPILAPLGPSKVDVEVDPNKTDRTAILVVEE